MNRYLEGAAPAIFNDPRNLHVGRARLIYAKKTDITTPSGEFKELPEGWVLPGGARLQNYEEAQAAARRLDDLIRFNHRH